MKNNHQHLLDVWPDLPYFLDMRRGRALPLRGLMFDFWVEMLDTSYVSCYDPQEEVLVISFFIFSSAWTIKGWPLRTQSSTEVSLHLNQANHSSPYLCHRKLFCAHHAFLMHFPSLKQRKVKLSLLMVWRHVGGGELWLHSFLTLTLNDAKWWTLCPSCFTPGKEPQYPLSMRLGGPESHFGCSGEEKNSLNIISGFKEWIGQSVAQSLYQVCYHGSFWSKIWHKCVVPSDRPFRKSKITFNVHNSKYWERSAEGCVCKMQYMDSEDSYTMTFSGRKLFCPPLFLVVRLGTLGYAFTRQFCKKMSTLWWFPVCCFWIYGISWLILWNFLQDHM